ncbi:dipeptidase PepE [Thalassotalea atypica]|uniref:dipeptidase PepE n=1 Tax=Thalassotalea atypica TaxID=2054316 RepID=UPI002572C212|nr:dipeptidase PepE [Thalassotalea atypica]
MKNLLLLSSSRENQSGYLEHALEMITEHLGGIAELLFVPYAGVSISYDTYTDMVQTALSPLGIKVTGIHTCSNPKQAINNAKAIAVGGGNTFHLLHQLQENGLIEIIQENVEQGMPYIGWSAGSNVAGLSIRTTNDMPIIEPKTFKALSLVEFQLNPHYTDYNPPGHNGETREQRLNEFMVINPEMPIVAIVEGTALKRTGDKLQLIGPSQGYLFKNGNKSDLLENADLSYLL